MPPAASCSSLHCGESRSIELCGGGPRGCRKKIKESMDRKVWVHFLHLYPSSRLHPRLARRGNASLVIEIPASGRDALFLLSSLYLSLHLQKIASFLQNIIAFWRAWETNLFPACLSLSRSVSLPPPPELRLSGYSAMALWKYGCSL